MVDVGNVRVPDERFVGEQRDDGITGLELHATDDVGFGESNVGGVVR